MNPNVHELFAALPKSQTQISVLELPSWVERRLRKNHPPIDTVEKLLVLNQRYLYYFVFRIGPKSLQEINRALLEHGYPELPWKPQT